MSQDRLSCTESASRAQVLRLFDHQDSLWSQFELPLCRAFNLFFTNKSILNRKVWTPIQQYLFGIGSKLYLSNSSIDSKFNTVKQLRFHIFLCNL